MKQPNKYFRFPHNKSSCMICLKNSSSTKGQLKDYSLSGYALTPERLRTFFRDELDMDRNLTEEEINEAILSILRDRQRT